MQSGRIRQKIPEGGEKIRENAAPVKFEHNYFTCLPEIEHISSGESFYVFRL